jgi:hypothetical protein
MVIIEIELVATQCRAAICGVSRPGSGTSYLASGPDVGGRQLADHMHPHTNSDLLPCPVRRVDRRLERHPQRQARAVS